MRTIRHFLRRRPRIGIATLIILAGLGASACLPPAPAPPRRRLSLETLQFQAGSPTFLDERTTGAGDEHDFTFVDPSGAPANTGLILVALVNPAGQGSFRTVPTGPTCHYHVLDPGETCTVRVRFESTGADGSGTATLRLTYNGTRTLDVPLTGTVRPDFEITGPTTITDPVGGLATSADYTITLVGDYTAPIFGDVTSLSGAFSRSSRTCNGQTILSQASCTFTVAFVAPSPGAFPAAVTASRYSVRSEVDYPIVGTGT